jgi:hypothetical protein
MAHGSRGSVGLDVAGGTTYVTLAKLNAWTLNTERDVSEITSFGDTNKVREVGLPDYSGTLGGFWDTDASPTLFNAIFGSTAVGLKLTPDTLIAGDFFSGLAYLTGGSVSVAVNGSITISSGFVAADNWALATAP